MKKNIGNLDALLRIIIGIILLSLIVIGPKTWWGLIGLVPIIAAIARYCPLYTVLGINTCKKK